MGRHHLSYRASYYLSYTACLNGKRSIVGPSVGTLLYITIKVASAAAAVKLSALLLVFARLLDEFKYALRL